MRILAGVILMGTVFSALAEPRIYPPRRIGDYIVQTTEISTNRHNTWLVRIEDPLRGVVCYMQLGDQMSCVRMRDLPASGSAPTTPQAEPGTPKETK